MAKPKKVDIQCVDSVIIEDVQQIVINESVVIRRMIEDFVACGEDVTVPLIEPYMTHDVMKFLIQLINDIERLDVKSNYVKPCYGIQYTFLSLCIQAAGFLDMSNVLKGLIYVLTLEMRKCHTVEDMSRAFAKDTTLRVGCGEAAGGEAAGGEAAGCEAAGGEAAGPCCC